MSTPLTITLQSNRTPDQRLVLTPVSFDASEFKITFTNRVLDVIQTFYLKQESIAYYLRTFLESVYYDDDCMTPIEHVQFDVPGYPTVIVKIGNLRAYIDNLLDQMEVLAKDWPVERSIVPKKTYKNTEPSHSGRVGMSEDW